MKFLLVVFASVMLRIQAGIDLITGRPLALGLGVDAPVTAAAVVAPAAVVVAPAAEVAPVTAPTLGSVIKGAFLSLGDKTKLGTDLAQVRADLATRTTERDTARSEVAALTTQVTAFSAFFGLKPTELVGKDSAALTALFAQKISESAVEQLASAGVPAAQLPKPLHAEAKQPSELLAEYNTLLAAGKSAEAASVYTKIFAPAKN